MIQLRSSQGSAIESARGKIAEGLKRGIIAAPCGFGKSVVACAFIEAAMKKNSKVWFAVDRQILVNDMSSKLSEFNIDHGVLMADHWRWKPGLRTQVVSIQTIEKRGWDADIDVLIVDEAHANMRKSFREFIKKSPKTKVIGLTATPFYKGMGEIYEYVVNPTTTNQQIKEGYLVPLTIYSCLEADMHGAKIVAGEYADSEVQARGQKIVGNIVQTWIEKSFAYFGGPAKTIVFSANVAHGEDIVKSFAEAGYNFVQISYQDPNQEWRDKVIAEFRKPDSSIHGLVSCGVLTRGFDVTDVKIGIMARPLRKSFSEFIQQIGRIQRAHNGKDFGLLLDHAGNVGRFLGEMENLFENGVQELDESDAKPARKELTEKEKKEVFCPKCGALRVGRMPTCGQCGYAFPKPKTVQNVDGKLREVKSSGYKMGIDLPELFGQLCTYVSEHSAPEKQQSRARFLFRDIVGSFPPDEWSIAKAEHRPLSLEVQKKIRYLNIRFVKSKRRMTA
jgi:DNA repair protein RadD